jgi:hypothetical protein
MSWLPLSGGNAVGVFTVLSAKSAGLVWQRKLLWSSVLPQPLWTCVSCHRCNLSSVIGRSRTRFPVAW